MAGKAKGAQTTAERWRQILRIMDEAFADYLTGMVALRKRVVGDVKRKVSDGEVPPLWNSRHHESDRLRRCGIGVRGAADLAADRSVDQGFFWFVRGMAPQVARQAIRYSGEGSFPMMKSCALGLPLAAMATGCTNTGSLFTETRQWLRSGHVESTVDCACSFRLRSLG